MQSVERLLDLRHCYAGRVFNFVITETNTVKTVWSGTFAVIAVHFSLEKIQVGNDQERAQSERDYDHHRRNETLRFLGFFLLTINLWIFTSLNH